MDRIPAHDIEPKPQKAGSSRAKAEVLDWLDTLITALLVVALIFTFFFRMVGISGDSMQSTLEDGDNVIITGAFYTPAVGDIVVISRDYIKDEDGNSPEPIIKRIIALAGQEVYIDYNTDTVYVDGVAREEPYIYPGQGATAGRVMLNNPHVVEEGHVFVLGDHRSVSHDSRADKVGDIDQRYILGRAVLRVFPFDRFEVLWDA